MGILFSQWLVSDMYCFFMNIYDILCVCQWGVIKFIGNDIFTILPPDLTKTIIPPGLGMVGYIRIVNPML